MKNIVCTIALVAASLLAFTACEDEHYSVMPTFSGFRFEPSAWHPGEKVSVTAVQQTYGDLLYRAKYTWKVECAGKELVDSTITVVYDTDKSDPRLEFQIPEDVLGEEGATYKSVSVGFNAEYSYSARAPQSVGNGTNDGHSGLYGSIRTTGSGELFGRAGGNASYTITSGR